MSLDHAETALLLNTDLFSRGSWPQPGQPLAVAGWELIGTGSTRVAYMGPDGRVYKVGNPWWNNIEMDTAANLPQSGTLDSGVRFRVPEFIHYEFPGFDDSVIETEYAGKTEASYEDAMELAYAFSLGDLHPFNLRLVDGEVYLIDLGGGEWTTDSLDDMWCDYQDYSA